MPQSPKDIGQCWNGEQGNFGDFLSGLARQIGNDVVDLMQMAQPGGMLTRSIVGPENPFGSNNTNMGLLGADLAPAAEILAGGLGGAGAAGTRGAGVEFSHWIPARFGGGRSLLNGNYVSPAQHYLHDPFRYPSGWRSLGDRYPAVLRQLDRIPNVIKGGAVGGAVGALGGGC